MLLQQLLFFYIKCTAIKIKTSGTLITNARIISQIFNLLPLPDFFFNVVKRKANINHNTIIETIIFPLDTNTTILGCLKIRYYKFFQYL